MKTALEANSNHPSPAGPAEADQVQRPTANDALTQSHTDPHRLSAAFVRATATDSLGRTTLCFWKGDCWRWKGTAYVRVNDKELEADVLQFIRKDLDDRQAMDHYGNALKASPHLMKSTITALHSDNLIRGNPDQPVGLGALKDVKGLISTQSGLLNIKQLVDHDTVSILPHTPEWFSTTSLPYAFDQAAKCPKWRNFLEWMFDGDSERISLVQEWMGYCLTPGNSLQKFLVLTGSGANGKSVLLQVLISILGQDNVSAISPAAFRDKFGLIALIGKLANVCADVDIDHIDEGRLKALVGGDLITADRKFRDAVEFKCSAKIIFATNNLPRFKDTTEGIWRRLCILPCLASIPASEQNFRLTDDLLEEAAGIFNFAVEGARRLHQINGFTSSTVSEAAKEALRQKGDPVRAFLRDRCVQEFGTSVTVDQLQAAASQWAADHSVSFTDEMLGKGVKALWGIERQKRLVTVDRDRPWEYRGIRLGTDWAFVPPDFLASISGTQVAANVGGDQ